VRDGAKVVFTKLTDTNKAAVFTVLVLFLALAAGLVINVFAITSEFVVATVYACSPVLAVLIMLLVVTRDGLSREGLKMLGLHRLGLSVWWIALGVTFLVSLVASIIVWATPLASFVVPEGVGGELISFLIKVVLFTFTFVLAEEIAWRGYLLPQLLSVGRTRAMVLVGLIQAAWHMPLIFLSAAVYDIEGNMLVVLPLFFGSFVANSFFVGYLRLYTGSMWPATLSHSVHNAAWGTLGAFTLTSNPVVVSEYLVGDYGILILAGAVAAAIWVSYFLRGGMNKPKPSVVGSEVAPAVK
jgi:membrane protease YdiL (CAAX protease family)